MGTSFYDLFSCATYASCGNGYFNSQDEFSDFEFWCSEVDEKSVSFVGGTQVAEDLGDMFISDGFAGFQLDDEAVVDEEVGEIMAEDLAVFISHFERLLLFHLETGFAEAMGKTVFIDHFEVAMAQISMQGKASGADLIRQ